MFKLPFGKRELEEIKDRERKRLLKQGKQELEKTLKAETTPIIGEPTPITPNAYGYLLYQGAKQKFANKQIDKDFLHVCNYKGRGYSVITESRV